MEKERPVRPEANLVLACRKNGIYSISGVGFEGLRRLVEKYGGGKLSLKEVIRREVLGLEPNLN